MKVVKLKTAKSDYETAATLHKCFVASPFMSKGLQPGDIILASNSLKLLQEEYEDVVSGNIAPDTAVFELFDIVEDPWEDLPYIARSPRTGKVIRFRYAVRYVYDPDDGTDI